MERLAWNDFWKNTTHATAAMPSSVATLACRELTRRDAHPSRNSPSIPPERTLCSIHHVESADSTPMTANAIAIEAAPRNTVDDRSTMTHVPSDASFRMYRLNQSSMITVAPELSVVEMVFIAAAVIAASGTVKEITSAFQFDANAFAGSARKDMDDTYVAKIERPIAQLGTRPPPATKPAVPFALFLK